MDDSTTRRSFLAGLAATIGGLLLPGRRIAADERTVEGLVVHEWGVMVLGSSDSKTVLEAPAQMLGGLPPFVPLHGERFQPKVTAHGWDKPVLHFYGRGGQEVSLTVGTPLGQPTAYWPDPELVVREQVFSDEREMMVYGVTEAIGMKWSGTLDERPSTRPRDVDPDHWWNALRRVPGLYFNQDGASERFVFYEGTARQDPTVTVRVTAEEVTLENHHPAASGPVALIVLDGERRSVRVVDSIEGDGRVVLSRREVLDRPASARDVLRSVEELCRTFGLTDEEGRAIAEAWRPDLLRPLGLLVISRMPPALYDEMFPLEVAPEPTEIVRVGLVIDTLRGQGERGAWLTSLDEHLDRHATALGSDRFEDRETASHRLAQLEDLAVGRLERLVTSPDTEVVRRARLLLERLSD